MPTKEPTKYGKRTGKKITVNPFEHPVEGVKLGKGEGVTLSKLGKGEGVKLGYLGLIEGLKEFATIDTGIVREHELGEARQLAVQLTERLQALEQRLEPSMHPGSSLGLLQSALEGLIDRVSTMGQRYDSSEALLYEWLAAESHNIQDTARLSRVLGARLYLDTDDEHTINEAYKAFRGFAQSLGFETVSEHASERGSWFKRFFVKSKEALSKKEVQERLKKGEHALQLKIIGKAQAEIDLVRAQAAAVLLDSIQDVPNASCQLGSIIVAKGINADGQPVVAMRTLTTEEMMDLEENSDRLKSPAVLIKRLEEGNGAAGESKVLPEPKKKIDKEASTAVG